MLEYKNAEELYSGEEEVYEKEAIREREETSDNRLEARQRSSRNVLLIRYRDYDAWRWSKTSPEALAGPEQEEWLKAMLEKVQSMISNGF